MPRQLGFGNIHLEGTGQRSYSDNVSRRLDIEAGFDPAGFNTYEEYRRYVESYQGGVNDGPRSVLSEQEFNEYKERQRSSINTFRSAGLRQVSEDRVARERSTIVISDNAIAGVNIDNPIYDRVDTLQLPNNTINGTGFSTSSLNGFSSQRPEIISLVDYEPIFLNQSELRFNDTGYFIDYKYQINQLRKDTAQKLFLSLSANQTTRETFGQVNNTYSNFVRTESAKLNIFDSVISVFDLFDKAFQVREIPEAFFRVNNLQNIKDFFVRKMGFSETSYNTFSDTKILYQLLFDLRSASEDYSVNLLNLTDPNRINDLNSVIVDTTYTKTNGFSFSLNSVSTPLNSPLTRTAVEVQNFGNFLNSLPENVTDRIKVLMQVLNRVLRVSRGLSKSDVRNELTRNFSRSEDDNPFDNIIGAPPRDIFTSPLGVNTIGSSLYLTDSLNPGIIVLPFESTIVDDGNTTYVPGNLYFKNLTIQNLSINQLVNYAEGLSAKIANTDSLYTKIFDFANFNNKLLPKNFILKFLNPVKNSLNYVGALDEISKTQSKSVLIIPALINLAKTDKTLKRYIFQYLLLSGLSSINNSTENNIFRNLARELKNTRIFPDIGNDPIFQHINLTPDNRSIESESTIGYERRAQSGYGATVTETSNSNQSINLRVAVDLMADKITNYVFEKIRNKSLATPTIGRTSLPNNVSKFLIESKVEIKRVLNGILDVSFDNRPNLFKDFIDIAIGLDQDAMILNNSDTYLNTNLTTTRYSNVSISYLLVMLFEIICSLTTCFFDVNFEIGNDTIEILVNKQKCSSAGQGIDKTIASINGSSLSLTDQVLVSTLQLNSPNTENSDINLTISRVALIDSYYDTSKKIADSLVDEEDFLKVALGIFGIISANLNNAKRIGLDVFNRLSQEQKNIIRANPNILKKSQYRISSGLLNELRNQSSLIDPFAFSITEDEYNHLLTLNNSLKTLNNERTKILTVGLPNGFIDSLNGKSSKINAISGAEQITDIKGQGLVNLAIYRKSLLFEDLKFKPKKFLFDLALFASRYPDNLTIDPFSAFSDQNGLITLKDKTNVIQDVDLTKSNINTYSKYVTFLSNQQKQEMFDNHIKDYLFGKYINLLTGLKITEEVFPINAYSNYITNNDQLNQLLRLYLRTVGINDTRPIREILNDARINRGIRDGIALIQNSLSAFRSELIDQIIFSEKMFDRILNVQVNIDTDFEIDAIRTPDNVLRNEYIESRLFKIDNRLFIRDLEGAILDEFYVSVEVIG